MLLMVSICITVSALSSKHIFLAKAVNLKKFCDPCFQDVLAFITNYTVWSHYNLNIHEISAAEALTGFLIFVQLLLHDITVPTAAM